MVHTCESFFASPAFPRESVALPGGGTIHVRVMSAGDRDRWEASVLKDAHDDFRARLVLATACDEAGLPMFSLSDLPRLSAMPVTILDPIVEAAARLNKLRPDAVEAEVKNSEIAPV